MGKGMGEREKERSASPMSNEGRNSWSREHLTAAFLQLLSEKPLEKITIRELCDRAGTGRATFYRNYQDLPDIARQYLIGLSHEWSTDLATNPVPGQELICRILEHCERHREVYEVFNRRGLIYLMKDVIISALSLDTDGPMVSAYSSAFVIYTLYGFVDIWFARGMRDDPEEFRALLVPAQEDEAAKK